MDGPGTVTDDPGAESRPRVTPDVAAEAAVWVARLHGPSRSLRMERECLAWQAQSATHREAFERCTETWQDVPRVTVASAFASAQATSVDAKPSGRLTRLWAPALAMAVVLASAALMFQQWQEQGVYRTGVGEQERVLLDDGTRVTLNTDTDVGVALDTTRRTVALRRGEALFEVAKDVKRPFIVIAGTSAVVAHGTTFSVRLAPEPSTRGQELTVTLVEGRVSLETAARGGGGDAASAPVRQMMPGERVRIAQPAAITVGAAMTQVDRPNLENVMAWQRGEAAFDDVSLADAVAEMNRYSRTPIVLLDPAVLGPLRVSGLYRTDNSAGFARAVAQLDGLKLEEKQGRIELSKPQ